MDDMLKPMAPLPLLHRVGIHAENSDNPSDYASEQWAELEQGALRSHGIEPVRWTGYGQYLAEVTGEWPGTHEFDGPNGWHWVISVELP